jgi:AcrR family transcriptional regulator
MAAGKRDRVNWHNRRNEIIDLAADLFAAKGYHATGVAELSEVANLGRGALYYYIESKENLLGLIHDRVMEDVLAAGASAHAMQASATERLTFLGRELIRIITAFPDHVWVFLHEFRNLTGDAAASFRKKRRAFEENVEEILCDGCASGEFVVKDTRLAALSWLGLHNYIYIWHHPGGPYTAEMIAEHFASIFLNGIHPRAAGDGFAGVLSPAAGESLP